MPTHTIKVVCARSGIRAVTLRAWERRYHLLSPRRTPSNYRLYSDRDVAILRWVKARVDGGTPIGKVADELRTVQASDSLPAALAAPPPTPAPRLPVSPADYVPRLFAALTATDELAATEILDEAMQQFDTITVCLYILQPCMAEIGAAWWRGEVRIATEHFASQFVRGRLLALFQALPLRRSGMRIIVGCAPTEHHDIGALMLAFALRRAGYSVEFLGANLDLEDLVEYARLERPALVCLSAHSEATAAKLREAQRQFDRLQPAPRFGYGGLAFNLKPDLCATVPGLFLGNDAAQAVASIRALGPPQRA